MSHWSKIWNFHVLFLHFRQKNCIKWLTHLNIFVQHFKKTTTRNKRTYPVLVQSFFPIKLASKFLLLFVKDGCASILRSNQWQKHCLDLPFQIIDASNNGSSWTFPYGFRWSLIRTLGFLSVLLPALACALPLFSIKIRKYPIFSTLLYR